MNEYTRYMRQAFTDNGVVELRHQHAGTWRTGWFDNADDLLSTAADLYPTGNLFTSLNRPTQRAVSNCMTGEPIRNDDVQWYTRLLFDFDPVRPTDTSATDAELAAAIAAAQEAAQVFRAMTWPHPLVAISGNGAHLLYRTHLPNTAEVRDMLATIYGGLAADHSGESVKFDRAVLNAGRICTLYGTIKRKGENSPDRPHRQARFHSIPREWRQVSTRCLEGVANFYTRRQQAAAEPRTGIRYIHVEGAGDYATLDAVAWFTAHGLYRRPLGTYNGSQRHAVRCPWEGEHSNTSHDLDTSTVLLIGEGWPGFYCAHDHCDGRTITDVMQVMGDADHFCARQWSRRHV